MSGGAVTSSRQASDDRTIRERFVAALDSLVETLKTDRSILAALLGGSLAHDMVWGGSDIDLVLVTVDDRKIGQGAVCLDADGVNVHAILLPRVEFRKIAEGAIRNSFMHSFLAKGRLIYSHDPTIETFVARLHEIGRRDRDVQMMRAATGAIGSIYKAHKWILTRGDWMIPDVSWEGPPRARRRGVSKLTGRDDRDRMIPMAPIGALQGGAVIELDPNADLMVRDAHGTNLLGQMPVPGMYFEYEIPPHTQETLLPISVTNAPAGGAMAQLVQPRLYPEPIGGR